MFSNLFRNDPDPREISNEDAARIYDDHGAIFLDVREPDEWSAGHMPGAIHIPLGDLATRVNELPADGQVITVCRSGKRSLTAVDILQESGRHDAKSMAGGMLEWSRNGRPLE